MARKDIHRPSAINPSEYSFVAFDYIKIGGSGNILADCAYLQEQRRIKQEHFSRTGGKYSTHEHGGNCMICGSVNAIYTATFYHEPSNTYIRAGSDCTDKLYGSAGYSDAAFNIFRKNIQNALEAHAGKKKAQAILAQKDLSRCWSLYISESTEHFKYEEMTIRDIVGKLVTYGSISDKAMGYLGTLLSKIDNRTEIEAQRKAEHDAAADCPSGRIEIVGKVLTVKTPDWAEDSAFPVSSKILVQTDSGFKVWGSRTANFEKGQRVAFRATVTPSQDDPKFGFFKRPSNARVIEEQAVTV